MTSIDYEPLEFLRYLQSLQSDKFIYPYCFSYVYC